MNFNSSQNGNESRAAISHSDILLTIPRPEYPRPQWVREEWLCLNGNWQFEQDSGDSGLQRGLLSRSLQRQITVPFCPESELSGIGETDFLGVVWYRREVEIPDQWHDRDVVLHFGAVDYDATVWVNGTEVARHRGGFSSFSCALAGVVKAGERATIVVRARDNINHNAPHPRGKQAISYAPQSCYYTRTTGIWQSVWMEPVPRLHLKRARITPDVSGESFHLEIPLSNNRRDTKIRVRLLSQIENGAVLTEVEKRADVDLSVRLELKVPADKVRLWNTRDPHLYGIEIELLHQNRVLDSVKSYGGLRSVSLDGQRVKINGESVFQRLVLDQGYYPDGVMTAPSDAALIRDIELSLAAGFNGARLHQKVFEERFLYHADRLGYLCWGEFADWGCYNAGPGHEHQRPGIDYAAQWLEVLERDYSHPSIVGWCALNETWQLLHDRITDLDDATRALFLACRAMDTSRPVIDASGYSHRVLETDVYDTHDYIYEEDFEVGLARFKARYEALAEGRGFANPYDYDPFSGKAKNADTWSLPWRGQPYWVSEFGGFKWNPAKAAKSTEDNENSRSDSWGYGSDPVSIDDFHNRFQAVCDVLLDNPLMFGYCYTQLTDVFPEENGLYAFDRTPKFDMERVRAVQMRRAAIETAEWSDTESDAVTAAALNRAAQLMNRQPPVEIEIVEEDKQPDVSVSA